MARGNKKNRVLILHHISWVDCLILAGLSTDRHPVVETLPEPTWPEGGGVDGSTEGVSSSIDDTTSHVTYVDAHHRHHGLIMYTSLEQGNLLPTRTTLPCHECRLTFDHQPLGCPLSYCHESQSQSRRTLSDTSSQGTLVDYYTVEFLFCSLSCVKAYILRRLAETRLPVYKSALTLVHLMATQMHGPDYVIPTAVPYTCQERWGGFMTEDQYRREHLKWSLSQHVNRRVTQQATGVWANTLH